MYGGPDFGDLKAGSGPGYSVRKKSVKNWNGLGIGHFLLSSFTFSLTLKRNTTQYNG